MRYVRLAPVPDRIRPEPWNFHVVTLWGHSLICMWVDTSQAQARRKVNHVAVRVLVVSWMAHSRHVLELLMDWMQWMIDWMHWTID